MLIGKALQRNPRDIATIISNQFTHAAVSSIEIAGPGFLKLFSSSKHILHPNQRTHTKRQPFF